MFNSPVSSNFHVLGSALSIFAGEVLVDPILGCRDAGLTWGLDRRRRDEGRKNGEDGSQEGKC
jgi:hypothetical protein